MTAPKDPAHNLADALELLERHIAILHTVKENQPIGLIRLSEMTGIPKHRVRYSLKILEQQGIIVPTSDGATVSDGYEAFMEDMADSVEEFAYKVAALRDVLRNRLQSIHLLQHPHLRTVWNASNRQADARSLCTARSPRTTRRTCDGRVTV